MHRFVMALGLTLLVSSAALAALPPQYQRQAELLAIIGNSAVVDAFEMEGIDAIEMIDTDQFEVRGGGCVLDVRIVDTPGDHAPGWVGPREFGVELGQLNCPKAGN